jgi:hypothetical protein
MSEVSFILTLISVILLFVFSSISGRGAFASSNLDIKLKYLFNKSNGDSSLPSNYRPISLISCVGKIMGRVICKHVYSYLHQILFAKAMLYYLDIVLTFYG